MLASVSVRWPRRTEVDIGEHLEHDVDTSASRGSENLLLVALLSMREHAIGSLLAHQLESLLCASGRKDREASRLGPLHAGDTDAAASTVNQHGLSWLGTALARACVRPHSLAHALTQTYAAR